MIDHYRIPESVLRAELEGDEVLLNPETGVYHLVNGTGKRILDSLSQGEGLQECIEGLARDVGAPVERVSADAEAFVTAMLERALLEPAD
jgi:hypothetical protein